MALPPAVFFTVPPVISSTTAVESVVVLKRIVPSFAFVFALVTVAVPLIVTFPVEALSMALPLVVSTVPPLTAITPAKPL